MRRSQCCIGHLLYHGVNPGIDLLQSLQALFGYLGRRNLAAGDAAGNSDALKRHSSVIGSSPGYKSIKYKAVKICRSLYYACTQCIETRIPYTASYCSASIAVHGGNPVHRGNIRLPAAVNHSLEFLDCERQGRVRAGMDLCRSGKMKYPEPGDFLTHEIAGVAVLVVRQSRL